MNGKKILTILKIIILLLLMLSVALLLKLNYKKNLKQETSEHIEHTIVYSKAISPMKKAKTNNNFQVISSSSEELLKAISEKIPTNGWLTSGEHSSLNSRDKKKKAEERKKKIYLEAGLYKIDIPDDYFDVWERKKENQITEFNFSGKDLGKLSTIPGFRLWNHLKRLNFSNCNITNINGFTNIYSIQDITSINLDNNKLVNIPILVLNDKRISLKNQKVTFDLGDVSKNNDFTVWLPNGFIANIKYLSFSPDECTIYQSGKIKFNTKSTGKKTVKVKINYKNSNMYGSTITYNYNVVNQSTNNNNNNNNNYNYNPRRRR